jgi:hypothetical protein
MDPEKLATMIQEAIREGITSSIWIVVLTGLIAAAVGALAGSYLKKKGENIATNEQFQHSLQQAFEQTTIVEQVKTDINLASQKSLESFKSSLSSEVDALKTELQDELKRNSEIFNFRYSKIYSAFEEISKLPPIKLPSKENFHPRSEEERREQNSAIYNESVLALGVRFHELEAIYNRVAPLVDVELKEPIEELIREQSRQTKIIIAHLHGGEERGDVDDRTVSKVRLDAITEIPRMLSKQLETLTWITDRTRVSRQTARAAD